MELVVGLRGSLEGAVVISRVLIFWIISSVGALPTESDIIVIASSFSLMDPISTAEQLTVTIDVHAHTRRRARPVDDLIVVDILPGYDLVGHSQSSAAYPVAMPSAYISAVQSTRYRSVTTTLLVSMSPIMVRSMATRLDYLPST
jgi:hypothetical protein